MIFSPPEITIRSFSNDQEILDKCFYTNHYKLKGFKEESEEDHPIVLDIGSHAGYFAFAALALGARKVYCFEPYFDNFKILVKNTEILGNGKINYHNLAIFTERAVININDPELQKGLYYDYANLDIDNLDAPFQRTWAIQLKDFLAGLLDEDHLDIIKISIGYAELDILEGCSYGFLERIESICGESSETPERIDIFKNRMKEKGYNEFYLLKDEVEEKYTFWLSRTNINKHFNIEKDA